MKVNPLINFNVTAIKYKCSVLALNERTAQIKHKGH